MLLSQCLPLTNVSYLWLYHRNWLSIHLFVMSHLCWHLDWIERWRRGPLLLLWGISREDWRVWQRLRLVHVCARVCSDAPSVWAALSRGQNGWKKDEDNRKAGNMSSLFSLGVVCLLFLPPYLNFTWRLCVCVFPESLLLYSPFWYLFKSCLNLFFLEGH